LKLRCFNFYDDFVVDQQVEPIAVVQLQFVVEDRNDLFGNHVQASFPQFMGEARSINAFQQTWPKS